MMILIKIYRRTNFINSHMRCKIGKSRFSDLFSVTFRGGRTKGPADVRPSVTGVFQKLPGAFTSSTDVFHLPGPTHQPQMSSDYQGLRISRRCLPTTRACASATDVFRLPGPTHQPQMSFDYQGLRISHRCLTSNRAYASATDVLQVTEPTHQPQISLNYQSFRIRYIYLSTTKTARQPQQQTIPVLTHPR